MNRTVLNITTEKQFTDITEDIEALLPISNEFKLVNIFSTHTTAGIKILENELLSLSDIEVFLEKLAPKNGDYRHDMVLLRDVPIEERINGVAHIRSLFFNSSETIPFVKRKLDLGRWQRIFLVELDGIRDREVIVTIIC